MKGTSYATLINEKILIPSPRTQYVAVDRSHLLDILIPTLRTINPDSEWYLQNNSDIATAIESGKVASAEEPYTTYGYYEHRMPYGIRVDEDWYLTRYPNVGEAVSRGVFNSATDHFASPVSRKAGSPTRVSLFSAVNRS